MIALPWLYLTLLSIGYVVALIYGQLGVLAAVSIALLLVAGYAVRQQRNPWARYLGHGLFIVLALGLAMHWLPGFYNGRGIAPQFHSGLSAVLDVPEPGQTPDRLLAVAGLPVDCGAALIAPVDLRHGRGPDPGRYRRLGWRGPDGDDQLGAQVAGRGVAVGVE